MTLFEQLKRIFLRPSHLPSQQPLAFDYVSKTGEQSRLTVYSWRTDGEYIVGRPDPLGREVTYRLSRVKNWRDLSWKQIPRYKPPVGHSPLDPGRLP